MEIYKPMKKILTIISAGLLLIATSCNKSQDIQPAASESTSDIQQRTEAGSSSLSLATRTVYYSTRLFNVKMMRAPLLSRADINLLYVIKTPAGTAGHYLPVINKLPSGNFSRTTLWRQIIVTFTADAARPEQPRSEDEIWKMIERGLASAEKTEVYFEMAITYALDSSDK
jgi:hypothetical protein